VLCGAAQAEPVIIDRFCKTPAIYHEILAAFVERGPAAAALVSREAKAAGVCVRLPRGTGVLFDGKQIVRRYKAGLNGPEVVIEGTLPSGRNVYIWVDKKNARLFLAPES